MLDPWARNTDMKFFELWTHVIGPNPVKKNDSKDSDVANDKPMAQIFFLFVFVFEDDN